MYRGSLSLRRLRVIVAGLPVSSRLKTVLRAEYRASGQPGTPIEDLPPEAWSETDWQLADVRDRLGTLIHLYCSVHRDPNSAEPAAPEPVPRPGVPRKKSTNVWFSAFANG